MTLYRVMADRSDKSLETENVQDVLDWLSRVGLDNAWVSIDDEFVYQPAAEWVAALAPVAAPVECDVVAEILAALTAEAPSRRDFISGYVDGYEYAIALVRQIAGRS